MVNIIVFLGLFVNGFINSLNSGIVFLLLIDFIECMFLEFSVGVIVGKLNGVFLGIDEGFVVVFLLLLILGLGIMGGFKL